LQKWDSFIKELLEAVFVPEEESDEGEGKSQSIQKATENLHAPRGTSDEKESQRSSSGL
jgi:hypothetical protein